VTSFGELDAQVDIRQGVGGMAGGMHELAITQSVVETIAERANSPAACAAGDLILLCPCGSADVEVLAGQELLIRSVEVA